MTMLVFSGVAAAESATPVAAEAKEEIRVLGRLNINEATRGQLLTVPGLEPALVDALLAQRKHAPLDDSALATIPAEAAAHLKSGGPSDYRRIRRLPLQVFVARASL